MWDDRDMARLLTRRADDEANGSVWSYSPNKAAPIVFIALFSASGFAHMYQNFRYKSWKTCPLLPWAALVMMAGFATREAGAFHTQSVGLLIASLVLVMSGPPVYAAQNYIIFSRCLFYIPYLSPINPWRILITLLGVDVLIEALIAQGASRLANTNSSRHSRQVGEDLVKSALILQAVFFVIFIGLGVHFQRACTKRGVLKQNLRTVLLVMYSTTTLVLVRCIYRIVEFFQGYSGTVYKTEWYFYVFEASLMFINTLILNIWHPGRYLPPGTKTFLALDGVTERIGPGFEDKRPLIVRYIDIFDLAGLVSGQDKRTRFWEWDQDELDAFVAEQKTKKAQENAHRKAFFAKLFPITASIRKRMKKPTDETTIELEKHTSTPDVATTA